MPSTALPIFRFSSIPGEAHAISTRHGGVSASPYATLNVGYGTDDVEEHVAANRTIFAEGVGLRPDEVTAGLLTHGTAVTVFRSDGTDLRPTQRLPVRAGSRRTEQFFASDGVVSDVPGCHFLLTFADCVPLVFVDEVRGVVGAAHAGWRGTAGQIGREVVRTMVDVFACRAADITCGIGPSIGPCCYTVGEQVLDTFRARGASPVLSTRDGSIYLDLWRSNERQLLCAGVESVETAGICTACHTDTYYSHRGEGGVTGRFAMIAGVPKD